MKSLTTSLTLLLSLFLITLSAPAQAQDVRTIEVVGADNLQFDVTLIEAEPGETLRIVFTTVSNMPPQAMSHNLVIMDLETDLDAFAMASMMAADNDYLAPDYEDQIIAATEMVGGGESSTIEFTVPETPGDYDYICTFPGHYQAGMVGILRVQ